MDTTGTCRFFLSKWEAKVRMVYFVVIIAFVTVVTFTWAA